MGGVWALHSLLMMSAAVRAGGPPQHASTPPIDRRAVVRRHIIRLHGDGAGRLGQEPPSTTLRHADCGRLEGQWWYAYDKFKLRPITVRRNDSQPCPAGDVSHRFTATVAGVAPCTGQFGAYPCNDPALSPPAPPVSLCQYTNGTIWLNRTEGACVPDDPECPTHQTTSINAALCGALNWTDYIPRDSLAAGSCSLLGTWYYQFDLHKARAITVAPAPASTACPDGSVSARFTATIANGSRAHQPWYAGGPTDVTLCSYTNGSLWLNKSEGACEPTHPLYCPNPRYQTSAVDTSSGCNTLRWTDHPLLPNWWGETWERHPHPPAPPAPPHLPEGGGVPLPVWCRRPGTSDPPLCLAPGVEEVSPGWPKNAWPLTLTVGNGAIGFNADATGLQSMNTTYNTFPLVTLSDWGWHATPWGENVTSPFVDYPYTYYNISTGREVGYPMRSGWFNANPHRINLLQVGLRRRGNTSAPLTPVDLQNGTGSNQELDPWTGEMVSNFSFGVHGVPVTTRTACHMDLDLISWRVDTRLFSQPAHNDSLVLRMAFPYADDGSPTVSPATRSHGGATGQGSNWDSAANGRCDLSENSVSESQCCELTVFVRCRHTSALSLGADGQSAHIRRTLDHDAYEVACRWSDSRYRLVADGPHAFVLQQLSSQRLDVDDVPETRLEMSCLLAPPSARYPVGANGPWLTSKRQMTLPLLRNKGATLPLFRATAANAAQRWQEFWQVRVHFSD